MNWFLSQFLPTTPFGWASMLIQAITWPATTILIAAMFRSEVRQLLERLVHLKVRDVEARFERALRETEDLAPPTIESKRVFHELHGAPAPAPRSPRAAISDAWVMLSARVDRLAGTSGAETTKALAEQGLLSGPTLLLFERLRQLHEQVAREDRWEPTADGAARYSRLARMLATTIVPGQ